MYKKKTYLSPALKISKCNINEKILYNQSQEFSVTVQVPESEDELGWL